MLRINKLYFIPQDNYKVLKSAHKLKGTIKYFMIGSRSSELQVERNNIKTTFSPIL